MILTIRCPCCDTAIRLELTATRPDDNWKTVAIEWEADDE